MCLINFRFYPEGNRRQQEFCLITIYFSGQEKIFNWEDNSVDCIDALESEWWEEAN